MGLGNDCSRGPSSSIISIKRPRELFLTFFLSSLLPPSSTSSGCISSSPRLRVPALLGFISGLTKIPWRFLYSRNDGHLPSFLSIYRTDIKDSHFRKRHSLRHQLFLSLALYWWRGWHPDNLLSPRRRNPQPAVQEHNTIPQFETPTRRRFHPGHADRMWHPRNVGNTPFVASGGRRKWPYPVCIRCVGGGERDEGVERECTETFALHIWDRDDDLDRVCLGMLHL